MAQFGVTYGGRKNPTSYGAQGARGLSSLYGNTPMQPMSSLGGFLSASGTGGSPTSFTMPRAPVAPTTGADDALARFMKGQQDANTSLTTDLGATTKAGANQSIASPSFDLSSDPLLSQIRALGQQNVGDAEANAEALRKQALIRFGHQAGTGADLFGLSGGGVDTATLQAAEANPFSTLASLQHDYQLAADNGAHDYTTAKGDRQARFNLATKQAGDQEAQTLNDLTSSLNNANLYYSSTRDNKVQNLNDLYNQGQSEAQRQYDLANSEADRNFTQGQTEGARSYQQGMAGAASNLQDLMGQIYGGVSSAQKDALNQEMQAELQAYQNAITYASTFGGAPADTGAGAGAGAGGPGAGSAAPDVRSSGAGGLASSLGLPPTAPDYLTALMLASRGRSVAV